MFLITKYFTIWSAINVKYMYDTYTCYYYLLHINFITCVRVCVYYSHMTTFKTTYPVEFFAYFSFYSDYFTPPFSTMVQTLTYLQTKPPPPSPIYEGISQYSTVKRSIIHKWLVVYANLFYRLLSMLLHKRYTYANK